MDDSKTPGSNDAQATYRRYLILRMRARVQETFHPVLKKMRRASLLRRERFIFTDKRHPEKGFFSLAMGLIALAGVLLSLKHAFDAGGDAGVSDAVAVCLAFLFSLIGLIFGILGRREKDVFFRFPNLGIFCNSIVLIGCAALFALGVL